MQVGRSCKPGDCSRVNQHAARGIRCVVLARSARRFAFPCRVARADGRGGGNLPNGQAGGFLGKAFDPFALMADPSKENFKVPDLLPPTSLPVARVDRRRRIRQAVEKSMTEFETSESARLMDEHFETAYRLMTSPSSS